MTRVSQHETAGGDRGIGECGVKRSVGTIILAKNTILREGMTLLLHHSNFKVIASMASPDDLPKRLSEKVRLVILGVTMGSHDKAEWLPKILPSPRNFKIVVVAETSKQVGDPEILGLLRSGADTCILNVQSRDSFLKALDLALLEQKLVVLGENFKS